MGPRFHHGAGGQTVGPDGDDLRAGTGLPDGGDQLPADPAALTVNHKNLHGVPPLSYLSLHGMVTSFQPIYCAAITVK